VERGTGNVERFFAQANRQLLIANGGFKFTP